TIAAERETHFYCEFPTVSAQVLQVKRSEGVFPNADKDLAARVHVARRVGPQIAPKKKGIQQRMKVSLQLLLCVARMRQSPPVRRILCGTIADAVAIIPLGRNSRCGSSHLPAASPSRIIGCLFGVAPRRDCPFHPTRRRRGRHHLTDSSLFL